MKTMKEENYNKVITVDTNGFVDIKQFKGVLPISKIEFYSLKKNSDKSLSLKFYDKDRKLIKPFKKVRE